MPQNSSGSSEFIGQSRVKAFVKEIETPDTNCYIVDLTTLIGD